MSTTNQHLRNILTPIILGAYILCLQTLLFVEVNVTAQRAIFMKSHLWFFLEYSMPFRRQSWRRWRKLKDKLSGNLLGLQHTGETGPTNSISHWRFYVRFHADQCGPVDRHLQHQHPMACQNVCGVHWYPACPTKTHVLVRQLQLSMPYLTILA